MIANCSFRAAVVCVASCPVASSGLGGIPTLLPRTPAGCTGGKFMRALLSGLALLGILLGAVAASAQQPPADPQTSTASCSFDDEKQISVQYSPVSTKEKVQNGKIWTPGGRPMILYTQTEVTLANKEIPIGAFSMYAIPGKETWTLIVNRNVTPGAQYDDKDDLVRATMETGQLSDAEKTFSVVFGHIGPKLCSMRFYFGKIGAWAEFNEK
jgi:hypothetical protein